MMSSSIIKSPPCHSSSTLPSLPPISPSRSCFSSSSSSSSSSRNAVTFSWKWNHLANPREMRFEASLSKMNPNLSKVLIVGGWRDGEITPEIEALARFAIDEYNKQKNATLEFSRVVFAKPVFAGDFIHHITIEAINAGKKELYEAKIWVTMDHKELQELKRVHI